MPDSGAARRDARYQRLLDAIVDYAIYELDAEGRIATWNAGAERLKGYRPDEVVGRHYSMFFSPEDREAGLPQRALAAAAADGRYGTQGWRVRKDGARFWAHVVLDVIRDQQGAVAGFAKVTFDGTEQRNAQIALQQAQEQLYQSQRMDALGQLTGGVAHDFNNLLTVILGNLELALEALPKAEAMERIRRALGQCMRSGERAATLTRGLLAFARRLPLEPRRLDVNRLIADWKDFLARALGEAVELRIVGEEGLWPIEADPAHLESAILNLAVNARDAMPGGGKLTIEAANTILDGDYCRANPEAAPGRYVQIAVTDSGAGMPPEVIARVFEPFFTTKAPGAGTGLGLSPVHGFVKQSGGHIKIYSEPGIGTAVKLYMPQATAAAAGGPGEQETAVPGRGGEAILLVEDDADVRAFLTEALQALNYDVQAAADGESALAIAARTDFALDLLLTDVVLPRMNGREIAEAVRALRPGLKVLYMTGYSKNVVVHHGRLDPGVELIQKPVARVTLAKRVRQVLDSPPRGSTGG